jgi:hypothetical protein
MDAACFSETLVTTYKTTRRHSTEDRNSHFYVMKTSNLKKENQNWDCYV